MNFVGRSTLSMSTAGQYGFRSAGERQASTTALAAVQKNSTWSDTQSVIKALERQERSMTNPLIRDPADHVVNRRDYQTRSERGASPTITIKYNGFPDSSNSQCNPLFSTSISDLPDVMDEEQQRVVGGQLLRQSRPASPVANLNQWFGELRQFGSGFSVPTKMSDATWNKPGALGEIQRFRKAGTTVGSGYLASQFGWLPFFGELVSSLEAMANSEKHFDQYARDSGRLIRRSSSRTIVNDAQSYTGSIAGSGNGNAVYTNTHSLLGVRVVNGFTKSLGHANFRTDFKTTVTVNETVRAGGLWEYFAADPHGIAGSLRASSQKAKLLLGDPLLSYATLWELAPWSWLVDWKFNFGSFLSFQESIATDSLASRRTYSVYERRISAMTHWYPYQVAGSVVLDDAPTSVSETTFQRRVKGTPYDMGIDQSGFSSQQWFILGALGLSKGPGIPL